MSCGGNKLLRFTPESRKPFNGPSDPRYHQQKIDLKAISESFVTQPTFDKVRAKAMREENQYRNRVLHDRTIQPRIEVAKALIEQEYQLAQEQEIMQAREMSRLAGLTGPEHEMLRQQKRNEYLSRVNNDPSIASNLLRLKMKTGGGYTAEDFGLSAPENPTDDLDEGKEGGGIGGGDISDEERLLLEFNDLTKEIDRETAKRDEMKDRGVSKKNLRIQNAKIGLLKNRQRALANVLGI